MTTKRLKWLLLCCHSKLFPSPVRRALGQRMPGSQLQRRTLRTFDRYLPRHPFPPISATISIVQATTSNESANKKTIARERGHPGGVTSFSCLKNAPSFLEAVRVIPPFLFVIFNTGHHISFFNCCFRWLDICIGCSSTYTLVLSRNVQINLAYWQIVMQSFPLM